MLARVAPGKHAQGRDHYLAAWEAAVERLRAAARSRPTSSSASARRPESVMEGCRAAIDRGVYPFVVPLRPAPGSIVADGVAALGRVRARGLRAGGAAAGRGRDDEPGRARRAACAARRARRSARSSAPSAAGATAVPRRRRPPDGACGRTPRSTSGVARTAEDLAAHHACATRCSCASRGSSPTHDLDAWDDGAVKVIATIGEPGRGRGAALPARRGGPLEGRPPGRAARRPALRRRPAGALRRRDAAAGAASDDRAHPGRNVAFFPPGWTALGDPSDFRGATHQEMTIALRPPSRRPGRSTWAGPSAGPGLTGLRPRRDYARAGRRNDGGRGTRRRRRRHGLRRRWRTSTAASAMRRAAMSAASSRTRRCCASASGARCDPCIEVRRQAARCQWQCSPGPSRYPSARRSYLCLARAGRRA